MSRAAAHLGHLPRSEWLSSEYIRLEVAHDATFPLHEQISRHMTALNLVLAGNTNDAFAFENFARCLAFAARGIPVMDQPGDSSRHIARVMVVGNWRPFLQSDLARLLVAYVDAGLTDVNQQVGIGMLPMEVAVRNNLLVLLKALLDARADPSLVPFEAYVDGHRPATPKRHPTAAATPESFNSPALAMVRAAEMARLIQASACQASATSPAAGPRRKRCA